MGKSILKIAIYDSDLEYIKQTVALLVEFRKSKSFLECIIHEFGSEQKLIEIVENGESYDLFLVGATGVNNNGINLCRRLRSFSDKRIMFLCEGDNDLALECFSLGVSNYIVKPIDKNVFFEAINKVVDCADFRRAKKFVVNGKDCMFKIPYHDILFVDTKSHIVFFHLIDGSIVTSRTIRTTFEKYIEKIIEDKRFLRVHYASVINRDYINNVANGMVEMVNGVLIPVSKGNLEEVREEYNYFL